MPNSFFQFKQFRIEQDKSAMKVGTDGVLLGAWADVTNKKQILDIGTGTGLIAIMLAQRSDAMIEGIEKEKSASEQAVNNAANSPWSDRLKMLHASFDEFAEKLDHKYDLVVSNPPYHKETIVSPHVGRQMARFAGNLDFGTILNLSARLLTAAGSISLILPASDEKNARDYANMNGMYTKRMTRVIPSPGKPVSRVLLEFSFEPVELKINSFIIEDKGRHHYSPDYIRLTREYYLKFE